jgi:hypothetical protein
VTSALADKQSEGTGTTERDNQTSAQKKWTTHTMRQATKTQPALLAANALCCSHSSRRRCRTWAAGRTITLRRTSKRVKEVVDKTRLPAVVRLSRSFWGEARMARPLKRKLQLVMMQLTAATSSAALPHSSCRAVQCTDKMHGDLQEC